MLVNSVNNISFGRALKSGELKRFSAVCNEGKRLAGQTGQSIFIMHDACLPQSHNTNTGVGHISSNESQEFFSYMKQYLGFNRVEVLPGGELKPNNGLYCPYSSSSLSLGNHQINLELLTQNKFRKILLPEEYKQVINTNTIPDKETIVNYNNVMIDDSAQEEALKKAYARFKDFDEQTQLKKDFRKFISQNDDWLEPKSIFKILEKQYGNDNYEYWSSIDSRLYDLSTSSKARNNRIADILRKNKDEAEYYKFKQFLADSHLAIGRKKLNAQGIELTGDCEINFSKDELWSNPLAFKKGEFIGSEDWRAHCLDFDSIIKDPKSPAAKLLKQKVQLNAKRYDSIRFDAGWAYIKPKIFRVDGSYYIPNFKDDILNFIENSVKEIKGQDYNLNNLIYEFIGGEIFEGPELIEPVKKRVGIYDTVHMKDNLQDIWGSNDAFLKRSWSPDKFIIGVSNHDSQPLRQIANNVQDIIPSAEDNGFHKELAADALSTILKIDRKNLQDPVEFAKAKWAEPMMAKNNMMFYMDVFGREERFNMHHLNTTVHPEKNFAYKIPANYKEAYHKAIQEGYGFNIMDSLEKVFKAKGLDQTQPKLYREIVKFRDILYENDGGKSARKVIKKNKYLKPVIIAAAVIIAAGAALAALTIRKNNNGSIKSDNKILQQTRLTSGITQENTLPKSNNFAPIGISFNDFINKSSTQNN